MPRVCTSQPPKAELQAPWSAATGSTTVGNRAVAWLPRHGAPWAPADVCPRAQLWPRAETPGPSGSPSVAQTCRWHETVGPTSWQSLMESGPALPTAHRHSSPGPRSHGSPSPLEPSPDPPSQALGSPAALVESRHRPRDSVFPAPDRGPRGSETTNHRTEAAGKPPLYALPDPSQGPGTQAIPELSCPWLSGPSLSSVHQIRAVWRPLEGAQRPLPAH